MGSRSGVWLAAVATAGLLLGACENDDDDLAMPSTQPPPSSTLPTTESSTAPTTTEPQSVPQTSPAPAPIDTSAWLPFVSEHYGFSMAYPPDWEAYQGSGGWSFPDDTAWPAGVEVSDWFYLDVPDLPAVAASVWWVAVEPGVSADDWFLGYCAVDVTPCDGTEPSEPASLDGHEGRLVRASDPLAYFGVGDRVYMAAIWQPDEIESLQPYGGGYRLLEALLSTIRLSPTEESSGASESGDDLAESWLETSTWATASSERYQFTIGHPASWSVIESSHTWDQATDSINFDSGGMEVFVPPDDTLSIYLAAWAVDVAPSTTLHEWAQVFCDQYVASCTDVEEMSTPLSASNGSRAGMLLGWDDGMTALIPTWHEPTEVGSIWEQPAQSGARIYIVESGRPDNGLYHSREFVEAFAASLCIGCTA
jgi:hypothetical protein